MAEDTSKPNAPAETQATNPWMGAAVKRPNTKRQQKAQHLKAQKEAMSQPDWLRELKRTMLSPEHFLAAVRGNGALLKHIPEPLRTEELCLAAVRQDGMMLAHVPEALRNTAICQAALDQTPLARQFVPPSLLDSINSPERSK